MNNLDKKLAKFYGKIGYAALLCGFTASKTLKTTNGTQVIYRNKYSEIIVTRREL